MTNPLYLNNHKKYDKTVPNIGQIFKVWGTSHVLEPSMKPVKVDGKAKKTSHSENKY